LERKLPKDIRDWYDLHGQLMETRVPEWIDENTPTEKLHFLRLPTEWQRVYMTIFWQLRQMNAEWLFYERVEFANENFKHEGRLGWKTDRGRVFILCGSPQHIQWYRRDSVSLPSDGMLDGSYIQVWHYSQYGIGFANYAFQYNPPMTWRRTIVGAASVGNQLQLEKYWKAVLGVTPGGWEIWGDKLYELLGGKK